MLIVVESFCKVRSDISNSSSLTITRGVKCLMVMWMC